MVERTFNQERFTGDGCEKSKFDGRDYDLRCAVGKVNLKEEEFPSEFMIAQKSKVYSQGSTSMCVAFSLAEIKESQELVDQKRRIRFSPGFIYANRDESYEGMALRVGLKALKADGVVPYADFPVTGTCERCQKELADREDLHEMFVAAQDWKIGAYYRVYTLEEIKYALMHVGPVLIAVPCYSGWNWLSGKITKSGKLRGYHAMVIVGWRDNDTLIVQNSWGTLWGNKGYGYFKYNDYEITEAWAVADENQEVPERPKFYGFILFFKNLFRILGFKLRRKDKEDESGEEA